jgi:hypothetical protein
MSKSQRTIKKWTPLEVSSVSVPADPNSGFGRSFNKETDMPMNEQVTAAEARGEAIAECHELAGRYNLRSEVAGFLTPDVRKLSGDAILAKFRGIVLDKISTGAPLVDMRPIDTRGFPVDFPTPGIMNAGNLGDPTLPTDFDVLTDVVQPLAAQRAIVGKAAQYGQEMRRRGFKGTNLVPPEAILPHSTRQRYLAQRVALASGNAPITPTHHEAGLFGFALQAAAQVLASGARLYHTTQNVSIPMQPTGIGGQWVAENTAPAEGVLSVLARTGAYHQLSFTLEWTRQLAIQSDPFVQDMARQSMLNELASAVDLAAINGSGVGAVPLGLLNAEDTEIIELGANGGAPTWSVPLTLMEAVESNDVVGDSLGFLTNFAVKRKLLTTPRVSGHPTFILDDASSDKLAGYPIRYTSNVPGDLTKGSGTNLSALIFGNWSDLVVCQFGPLDVIVDPFTESKKGNVRISVHSAWDFIVRRPESFAICSELLTTP